MKQRTNGQIECPLQRHSVTGKHSQLSCDSFQNRSGDNHLQYGNPRAEANVFFALAKPARTWRRDRDQCHQNPGAGRLVIAPSARGSRARPRGSSGSTRLSLSLSPCRGQFAGCQRAAPGLAATRHRPGLASCGPGPGGTTGSESAPRGPRSRLLWLERPAVGRLLLRLPARPAGPRLYFLSADRAPQTRSTRGAGCGAQTPHSGLVCTPRD